MLTLAVLRRRHCHHRRLQYFADATAAQAVADVLVSLALVKQLCGRRRGCHWLSLLFEALQKQKLACVIVDVAQVSMLQMQKSRRSQK